MRMSEVVQCVTETRVDIMNNSCSINKLDIYDIYRSACCKISESTFDISYFQIVVFAPNELLPKM